MTKTYANAAAFRQALETRLRTVAQQRGVQIQGLRLKVAIERLLARLFYDENPPWILKGGYAMELRFRPKARTTRDVDLTLSEAVTPEAVASKLVAVHEALVMATKHDLGDYFEFVIPPARSELTAALGGGGVFSIVSKVAGRDFARFHIDIGFGDIVLGEPECLPGDDLMAFAGIAPAYAYAIPRAQQFAEKIHAYTFQWTGRENTRSRDLVDMVLLIERGDLDREETRRAIIATFKHRKRQPLPGKLELPPDAWRDEFPPMAHEAGLSVEDIDEAFTALSEFWNRLLPFDGADA